jgi:hypothetical protein
MSSWLNTLPVLRPEPFLDRSHSENRRFRMRSRGKFDVIIVGGGNAGAIAAIASARMGASTLLVEQYGNLGGALNLGMSIKGSNDGEGCKVLGGIGEELLQQAKEMSGATETAFDPRHGAILGQDPEVLKMLLLSMASKAMVRFLLHSYLVSAVVDGDRIESIIVANKGGLETVGGKNFVDCSGDADLAALSGAPTVLGRECDGLMQPASLIFRVGNVDLEKLLNHLEKHPEDMETPEGGTQVDYTVDFLRKTQWAGVEGFKVLISKARSAGDFEMQRDRMGFNPLPGRREVTINITRVHHIDGTNPLDLSRAEVEGQLQMLEAIRFLNKYIPGFEHSYVVSSPYQVGIRETRRIKGAYTLTREDVVTGRDFFDRIGRGAYPMDIHDVVHQSAEQPNEQPNKGSGVSLWRIDKSYSIPARCLIPQVIGNLAVAGRAISATHEAAGSTRGQAVCMVTGHAAGAMAALASQQNDNALSSVSVSGLQTLLRTQGAVLDRGV